MIFYLIILLVIIQRLYEMYLGKRNLHFLKHDLIYPVDQKEKNMMIFLHSTWFLSLLIEFNYHGKLMDQMGLVIVLIILGIFQLLRFQNMKMLGRYWTPLPVAFNDQKIITTGPYQYMNHPNYLLVIGEIALIPLLGRCWITAIFFSILNFIFLKKRISIEENALKNIPDYQGFLMKKKLFPFLLLFLIIFDTEAKLIIFKKNNYNEAKIASTYFMFRGESTKLGFITTSFDGYAKNIDLYYEENNDQLKNIFLIIETSKIDTDLSYRDQKMHDYCLEIKKYPEIKIEIPKISLSLKNQIINATMIVKDKKIPLEITLHRIDSFSFKGESHFKLSESNIPDPSIQIAKVKDKFEVHFQVSLPK